MVGEIYSLKPTADNYNGMLICRTVEQVAATPFAVFSDENLPKLQALGTATAVATGHGMPRIYTELQIRPVLGVGKHGHPGHAATLLGLLQYPNPVDGGLHLYPVHVHEMVGTVTVLRGRLRGFWHFLHPLGSNVNDGDTWAGTGPLAGKSFMAIKPTPANDGVFVMETSDTWETN
jgi:hypothetical protein